MLEAYRVYCCYLWSLLSVDHGDKLTPPQPEQSNEYYPLSCSSCLLVLLKEVAPSLSQSYPSKPLLRGFVGRRLPDTSQPPPPAPQSDSPR